MPRNYQAAANSTTSQRARESCYQFKKKWESIAKVNPVSEKWWRPLVKTFQKWEDFGRGSERIPITYVIVTARSKVKLFKSIGALGYLNTWLPRSIFIYSNNTLLTAGCCKSELRYLKHWYRLLCPSLVKPILGRSWYMRLFHTPSNYKALKTQFLLGFYFHSRKELESALSSLFGFLSPSLCIKVSHIKHEIKTSWKNFNGFSLPIALLVFTCGQWRQGVWCVIQSLPHPDLLNGFVSGVPFVSPPPTSPI